MPTTLEMLKAQIGALPPGDRAELIDFMLATFDPADREGEDPAWRAEMLHRFAEMEAGTVVCRPLDEALAELLGRLRRSRS